MDETWDQPAAAPSIAGGASNEAAAVSPSDLEAVQHLSEAYQRITNELGKVIVGQHSAIEELLVAMFSGGHCLLVGVPGLAKTLLIRTLAKALDLTFSRIQFTPDLMPADITGTEVIQEDKSSGQREFKFLRGPLFANVVLADEINRTPPKTQAALLEAMQEQQVTAGGKRHGLPAPFFVLATQNPIEQEGTYPLPEAQLDRFMFHVQVGYPTEEEELAIVRQTTAETLPSVQRVLSHIEITAMQQVVRRVPVSDHVIRYAMQFSRRSRRDTADAPDFVKKYVSWGAGPRASQYLILGAKARAVLQGRFYVSSDDVRAVAKPVLRHRIITNFNAEADGIRSDDVIDRLADRIQADPDGDTTGGRMPRVFKTAAGAG
jgi:MoxR-like ATPase